MKRLQLLTILFCLLCTNNLLYAQHRSFSFYLENAYNNSPLIQERKNQMQISKDELERLKAQYTRSRLEMNGDYLFVPIINCDNGKTSFSLDAPNATNYYGYDTGVTSGELRAGLTWTKPLLGNASYRVAQQKENINRNLFQSQIQMERHELNRAVTEQYLLCQSDRLGLTMTDSIARLLQKQKGILEKLVRLAIVKQSDLHLLDIELRNNAQTSSSFRQSYWNHLLDLNLLCGISDTTYVDLDPVNLKMASPVSSSRFLEPYMLDSLSLKADNQLFNLQYRPQLNLFVDGGLRTSQFKNSYQHFGMSAGISFSWLISDGKQRKAKYRQMQAMLNTNEIYRQRKQLEILQKQSACCKQLAEQDMQLADIRKQLTDYDKLLYDYQKEMMAGQRSVLDYFTVLKNYIQQKKEYDSLLINRELIINASNYWNW